MTNEVSLLEDRLTRSELLQTKHESGLNRFAVALAYGSLVQPVEGLLQLVDNNEQMNLHRVASDWLGDLDDKCETSSCTEFLAKQAGHAVATIGTFYLMGKLVAVGTRRGLSELDIAHRLGQDGILGLSTREAVLTSFLHDSVLRPVDSSKVNSVYLAHLCNGITGGITVGSMCAIAGSLTKFGKSAQSVASTEQGATAGSIRSIVGSKPVATLLAATTSGAIGANMDALFKKGTLASAEENAAAIVLTGIFAGGLSFYHHARGTHNYRLVSEYEQGKAPHDDRFIIKNPKYSGKDVDEVANTAEQIIQRAAQLVQQGELKTAIALEEHLHLEYKHRIWGLKSNVDLRRFPPATSERTLTEFLGKADARIQPKHAAYLRQFQRLIRGKAEHTMEAELEGEMFEFVTTRGPRGDECAPIAWRRPPLRSIEAADRRVEDLFQQIVKLKDAPRTVQTLESALKNVGEIEWLSGESWRYFKGSAGVQQLKARTLLEVAGVKAGSYRVGIDPNLESLSLPLDQYLRVYSRFYSEKPSFYRAASTERTN